MRWLDLDSVRRAWVVERLRRMVGLEMASSVISRRRNMEALLVAADTLEDEVQFRNIDAERDGPVLSARNVQAGAN